MNRKIEIPAFDFTGKTILVTGATKGLGYGIASAFAQRGGQLVITSRTEAEVQSCAQEFRQEGFPCVGVRADSSKQADIDRVIAEAVNAYGHLDILINNAGIGGKTAGIFEQTEEDFMRVIDVNLKGAYLFGRACAMQMVRQGTGGRILNLSSAAGLIGGKNMAPYCASKAGVISLTKVMANEWARYGILVNAVCPGYVITPLNEDVFANPAVREKMEKRNPVRRLGTVEEIAGPVVALASECFSYMTGASIVIDGGETIGG